MKDVFANSELFAFVENEIRLAQMEGRSGRAQNLKSVRNSFRAFLGSTRLPFSKLTHELIASYEGWLKERGVTRNSSSFYLRLLRSIYNKAGLPGRTSGEYPFKDVYTGVDDTRKRAVDKQVIARLINLDLSGSYSLSLARDLFLLSFYMRGIAYVDMAFLKRSDILRGEIHYFRHKTGAHMRVRLESCILEIFERYANRTRLGYLLPIISEKDSVKAYEQYRNKRSYYNKLLKRLSKLIDLSIPLTSYVSRHTWATVARDINVAMPVISAGMGHSSEMVTRIYLASLDASTIDSANLKIINYVQRSLRKRKM